ncbi:MAG: KEOPS complex subunit Cgi121 [Thermoplasmata archaeon]|nr:KEOPS complex subunit Cgi121 [Thermoplasmata archaeon]
MIIFGIRGIIQNLDDFLKKVTVLEKENKITIQLFRADRIFGQEHLVSATEKAVRTWDAGRAMSRTLGMEIMLYAAAERQTSEAIRKIGIHEGISEMAVVIVGQVPENLLESLGVEQDDSVLEPKGKDPAIFGITREEIETEGEARIPELVLEKIALSEVTR